MMVGARAGFVIAEYFTAFFPVQLNKIAPTVTAVCMLHLPTPPRLVVDQMIIHCSRYRVVGRHASTRHTACLPQLSR